MAAIEGRTPLVPSLLAGTVLPREEETVVVSGKKSLRLHPVSSRYHRALLSSSRASPAHVTGAHDRTNTVMTDDRFGYPRIRAAKNRPRFLGTKEQMLFVRQSSGLTLLVVASRLGDCPQER